MLLMKDPPVDHKMDTYWRVIGSFITGIPTTTGLIGVESPGYSVVWTGGLVVMVLLWLDVVCAGSCSSSVVLQHSAVRVPFSPSAKLDFSPSRERESWAWKLDLPIVPGVTHKDRIPWPLSHHVLLHKILEPVDAR